MKSKYGMVPYNRKDTGKLSITHLWSNERTDDCIRIKEKRVIIPIIAVL